MKLLLAAVLLACSYLGYAQCGTETFSVTDWCENSYAEWKITNPDPTAKYHWYEPVYNAAGTTIVDTLDRNYGENAAGTDFVSPYRYTTPSPTPTTPNWDYRTFWYVKEKPVNFSLANPTVENHSVAPATGYSMNFTSSLETRINYVTIPFFSYYVDPSKTWYVQVQIGTKYSAIYYFNSTNLTKVTSNVYLLRVPVFIDTPAGSYTMTVVTNPASPTAGTVAIGTNQLDLAMLNTATTFPINNTAGINITGASNSGKSMIYKWETDTYCPYTLTPPAKKTTTGCCVPVLTSDVVVASNPIIVSGTDNSVLNVTVYESTSNYFQWYKNGTATVGGPGMTSITVNQAATYSVREVKLAANVNNISCYQETAVTVQERALFTKVNNPKASYCVGDKVTVEAYGSNIGSVSWSPASLAASPNSKITDVTLSATGTLNFTATAQVFTGPSVINGDFESGNTGFTSDMTNTSGTPSSGQYRIDTYVTEQQSYWSTSAPGTPATQMKGSGKFLYSDGFQTYQPGSIIWKQTVTGLSQSQDYTFSMDHANISWNSDPSNTARVADIDTKFDIFINNFKVATFTTDGQGQYAGVGRWKTDQVVWNSGTATQAVIEIKQQVKGGAGYDFAIDNILFGGPVTQTSTVSVGPIADCFDVIPSQSACVGANKTLTAKAINTVTGDEVGVIDRWEAPVGTVVGTGKTITVSPLTTTTYTVYARFPASNLIQNSDFELGVNGFKYGTANGLYNQGNSQGNFSVLKNPTTTGCGGYCVNLGDHTSGTGNMLFVDPQSADGNVIAYDFNAIGGQSYLFSLWVANAVNFASNPNPLLSSVSFIVNGPGVTNQTIASINTSKDNVWNQLSAVWTPPSNGAYTLTIRAKGDATLQAAQPGNGGGNDFVIDDIILAEPTSKVYSKTIVVTPCVTCTKPSTVVITTPAASTLAICQGTAQTLSGSVTVTAASTAAGGFKYSWIKVGTATPLQTAAITLVANTATPVPDYTGITGALTDAGKYILRVEDGSTGAAACFTDDTLTLTVNPKPTITSASTGTICSGIAQNYTITSSVPSSYAWTRAIVTGVNGNAAGSGSGSPLTDVLTLDPTITIPTAVVYKITPTSTTGSCVGTTFDYTVTVNPKPVITSSATGTVCSGIAQNYAITSNVASGYAWTRPAVTGVNTGVAGSGSTSPITDVLTLGSTIIIPTTVVYKITPTATTGSCVGATFDYTVTVNPTPTITSSNTGAICSGIAQNYAITSNVASSYAWTRAAVTGVTPITGSGSTSPITEPLTLGSAVTIPTTVVYKITPTATTGSCVGATFDYTVTVNPKPVITSAVTGTICSGVAQNYAITSNVASNYAWARAAVAGVTPNTGSSSTSPINETLTNSNAAAAVVQYVITPTSTSGSCAGTPFNYDVTVNPALPVSVSIATPSTTICAGTSVTFTATPTNGGTTPTYQWYKGAVGSGTPISLATSATYTTTTAANNDSYYVMMTSNATCPTGNPATSNAVVITVTTVVTPAVTITASPGGAICAGTSVTFTATPGNGGNAPTYEWFIGTNSQGAPSTTANTFTSTALVNGDQVSVKMVSNSGCASTPNATSNVITMTVNPNVTPTVTLTADKTTICPGDQVTYTATSTNGGTPTYTWNGTPTAAGTGATYTTTALTSPNSVTVTVNSTLTCVTSVTATSSPVMVTVTPVPTISVSIAPDVTSICANNPVVFTATVSGSGSTPAPTYEWFITGVGSQGAPSTTATTFATSALTTTNNKVYVQVVSNATCASTTPVLSNVVTTTVNAGIGAGTIGIDQTICYNGTPAAITETAAPAGTAGTLTYVWQETTTPGVASSWGPVTTGAPTNGGKDFTPSGTFTSDIYYRRIITDAGTPAPCNTATSNVIHITVRPDFVAGTISTDQTICSGAVPAAFANVSLPTGGDGAYTYKWEKTDALGNFGPVSGTSNTYASGALTATTKFRRVETSGCGTVYSNVVTVTITSPETVTASINDPGQVCAGSAAFTFTATAATTGTGTLSYEWYL
ncbi:MAG: beta strand repeat-containing protein, partial [Cytophaga sp.]|uniref:beta strand repeat-containing protein n=1 Tax=Cytophaga sp. TaxID=29535 RepID=UPI003F804920